MPTIYLSILRLSVFCLLYICILLSIWCPFVVCLCALSVVWRSAVSLSAVCRLSSLCRLHVCYLSACLLCCLMSACLRSLLSADNYLPPIVCLSALCMTGLHAGSIFLVCLLTVGTLSVRSLFRLSVSYLYSACYFLPVTLLSIDCLSTNLLFAVYLHRVFMLSVNLLFVYVSFVCLPACYLLCVSLLFKRCMSVCSQREKPEGLSAIWLSVEYLSTPYLLYAIRSLCCLTVFSVSICCLSSLCILSTVTKQNIFLLSICQLTTYLAGICGMSLLVSLLLVHLLTTVLLHSVDFSMLSASQIAICCMFATYYSFDYLIAVCCVLFVSCTVINNILKHIVITIQQTDYYPIFVSYIHILLGGPVK